MGLAKRFKAASALGEYIRFPASSNDIAPFIDTLLPREIIHFIEYSRHGVSPHPHAAGRSPGCW